MRIGFNANTFTSPKIRGFTRHTLNLIEAIHRIAPDTEIFLFANRELSPSLLQRIPFAQPKILRVKPFMLWEQLALPLQLAWEKIDVFHSTTNTGVPFFRPFYCTAIQTVHDTFTHENLRAIAHPWTLSRIRSFYGFWLSWRAALSADTVITVSEFSRKEICRDYPELSNKICVIPNAVDPIFTPGAANPEAISPFGLHAGYILYVGGFEERKNIATLIEAYRIFRARLAGNKNLPKLVLVGAHENLPRSVEELLGRTEGVVFLAYCTDLVLLELYRAALFGVFPSYQEGFGFPALEFAKVRVPVILSDIPAFREVAKAAAPYFPPADPNALAGLMERLWNEPEWRETWKAKLSHVAEEYSWEKIARATLTAYKRAE